MNEFTDLSYLIVLKIGLATQITHNRHIPAGIAFIFDSWNLHFKFCVFVFHFSAVSNRFRSIIFFYCILIVVLCITGKLIIIICIIIINLYVIFWVGIVDVFCAVMWAKNWTFGNVCIEINQLDWKRYPTVHYGIALKSKPVLHLFHHFV